MADSAELTIVLVDKGGPPSGPRESPREREASRPDRVESESKQKFGEREASISRPTAPAKSPVPQSAPQSIAYKPSTPPPPVRVPPMAAASAAASAAAPAATGAATGAAAGAAASGAGAAAVAPAATGLAASLGVASTAVGVVASGLTLVAGAAVAAGASLKLFGNMIVERGAELAKYSGAISQSRAMADVREMRSDIREAEALGPGIASVTDSMSQLWAEIREFLLPIKKVLVETIADILKWFMETMKEYRDFFIAISTIMADGFKALVEALQLHIPTAIGILADIPENIVKAQEAAKQREKAFAKGDMLDDFIKRLEQNRPFGAAPADPFGNNFAKQRLNVPIFAGV